MAAPSLPREGSLISMPPASFAPLTNFRVSTDLELTEDAFLRWDLFRPRPLGWVRPGHDNDGTRALPVIGGSDRSDLMRWPVWEG